MVELSDDCFTHNGALMTVAEALEQIETRLAPVVEVENVPLRAAVGRVLAQDVVAASMNLPPHANSAVDGYAVAHSALSTDRQTVLSVGGRVLAGHSLSRPVRRGEAIRIFTGALIPEGADTVIMQEDCVAVGGSDGGQVWIRPGARKGANYRHAGEDVSAGTVVLRAGRRLLPADLGLSAALGCDRLPVFRPLRVALLSTGNEVREPGRPLPRGAIYDANRVMLTALLEGVGCVVNDLGIQPDRATVLADALARAGIDHDLIVTSGGMSTGDEDHVRNAIEQLGHVHFWRLAIKPGRPVALGQIGTVPLIGLPGNPVAAFVTFVTIAKPLILKLAGAASAPPKLFPVRAGFAHRKKLGRREYLRVSLERDGSSLVAMKYPHDGSAILSSIVKSHGFAVLETMPATWPPAWLSISCHSPKRSHKQRLAALALFRRSILLFRRRRQPRINLHRGRHPRHEHHTLRHLIDVDAHWDALWAKRTQVKIGLTLASPCPLGCAFATLMPRAMLSTWPRRIWL